MTKLAQFFSALVRAQFDTATLTEINRRNALPDYAGCCATHDFCDANALMYGAFCAVYFKEPDSGSESDANETNAAWSEARKSGFAA